MGLRYHIFAGTNDQARHLAIVMCMEPGEWKYLDSADSLLGLRGGVVLCFGTWRHRPDRNGMMTLARERQMHILEVS